MDDENQLKKRTRSIRLSKKDRKRVCNYFGEYCNSTSIHGFKYLGERKRSCLEKLWWLITIIVCVVTCIVLMTQTYNKWNRSPVIVSFATKQTPIWQIPFPAVTICPETKSRQSVFNFTRMYSSKFESLTATEKKEYEYISLICSPKKTLFKSRSVTVDEGVLEFFDKISPSFKDTSLDCFWMGERITCEDLFTPILTDDGVCYTFNMLDREDMFKSDTRFFKNYLDHERSANGWSLEDGYAKTAKLDTFPRRALFSGAKNGLYISLAAPDKDLDYFCRNSIQGYKILLHHPAETPRVSQMYFQVPLDQAVVAAITPEVMTTSSALKTYDPEKRQCFFPHERKLRFFKIYTQQNCEVECLSNFTYSLCKCVDFHMPRDRYTPICGPARNFCMTRAERFLLSNEIDVQLKEMEEESLKTPNDTFEGAIGNLVNKFHRIGKREQAKKSRNCNCLPACTSLTYSTETSQTNWDWVHARLSLIDPDDYANESEKVHLSEVTLFFKDTQFIASERDELYGSTDFLANCGGLLGLFTGFSVISLIEIIYFLSLRLVCNIRTHGRKYWAGHHENH